MLRRVRVRMTLGWRGGKICGASSFRDLASTLWAASEVIVALVPGTSHGSSNILDTTRYALWFGFLYRLVGRVAADPGRGIARLRPPWWLSSPSPWASVPASSCPMDRGGSTVWRSRGRRRLRGSRRAGRHRAGPGRASAAQPRARAMGRQAAVPGVDRAFRFRLVLLLRCHAVRPSRPGYLGRAGIAHALVLPFVGIAAARNPAWTIEMHLSRNAVLRSSALLVSGLFLLAVAPPVIFCASSAGSWATRCKSNSYSQRAPFRVCGVFRHLQVQGEGLRQQAFLFVPVRLPGGVAAVHTNAVGGQLPSEPPAGQHPCARRLGRKPGGRLWLRHGDHPSGRPRGGTWPA